MLDAVNSSVVNCPNWRVPYRWILEGVILSHHQSRVALFATTIFIGMSACATTPVVVDEQAKRKMLALLMPARIEIVEPFTHVKSFDNDDIPDGIELLLQAVNTLDNPGLMIAGHVRVELFEFVTASADKTGQRLEHWEIELTTTEQQKTYWNQLTQMYEFRLGIDTTKIPLAEEYVIVVTYSTPLGEYLTDDYVIKYNAKTQTLNGT